ncbi:hypothetical protein BYT27DRAFT_7231790 [Phlegmacium glaucopus]|nr:hypothetical protein BYT27DRAFT_7231790 [Phlegmacium glaucopus]
MSFFNKSKNVSISGGSFVNITKGKGIDILSRHIAPGAFHNSAERYDPPKCHPQTRVAVIQAIIDWIEDGQKTSFIKWLNGPAGAGKSAIAQEIAELYHKSGRLAASFFWSRNVAGRNNEERLVASLAYQLLIAIPQIRGYIEEALENDPSLLSRSLATQMESLVVEPLEKVFGHHQQRPVNSELPKLIILDGLDECGTAESQQYILKVISDSILKFPIPLFFLISSRPEQAIRDSFNDQHLLELTVRLVLDEKYHPDDDIKLFLVESFESMKRGHALRSRLPYDWPIAEDIDQLVRKSSGQFIYAATVVKFVRSPRRRPCEQLKIILGINATGNDTPFAELDALYYQIFSMVEDLPRILEVLSSLFLIDDLGDSSARLIETILSYAPGDLQLILIDLHSVLDVPDMEDDYGDLRALHASLEDFLMDPARSGNLFIDRGKAHAQIARHFLRYIRDYDSRDTNHHYDCGYTVFITLEYHCSNSSATRELLADFYGFDFRQWAATMMMVNVYLEDWALIEASHRAMVDLYTWFRSQEANVQDQFGPGRSLYTHHSASFEAAVDLIFQAICREIPDQYSENGENAFTAITHPQIVHHRHWINPVFETVNGFDQLLHNLLCIGIEIVEFQKYLSDPERAGRYFVNSRMYTTLSVLIFKFIFGSRNSKYITGIQEEQDGSEKEDDNEDYMALISAIDTLPFYLSNADYTPKLARRANRLLSYKIKLKDVALHSALKVLHEAIDLYLKKIPLTSNSLQEKFQKCIRESRLIDLDPEQSVNTAIASSELRFREGKRRRNSGESINVMDSTLTWASGSILPTSKRLRIADMLNPAM